MIEIIVILALLIKACTAHLTSLRNYYCSFHTESQYSISDLCVLWSQADLNVVKFTIFLPAHSQVPKVS